MIHTIIQGDCLQVMKTFPENHFDFIVTDPPYGLHFMGKDWDHGVPGIPYWQEALRICKPGAMLATFGGTRTHHRLMTALEDAGWEIRDVIMWIFGSGFPKSHNFGKLMQDEAWKGYGTALKPAHEPIILCQKPYEISRLFVMILMDITNEVFECQKLNYNVNDAEMNLSDTLLLLDKEHQCIVQEPAKTCAWEKLSDVNYVMQNATFLKQELQEKINLAKELFVLENVKDSGRQEDIKVKKILAGEEECIFAGIQGIATFVTKEPIEQNIVLLWKIILQGIFQGMNKFTIRTVINLITELKILKLCLHPNISNDIGSLNPKFEPIILAMKPLDGTFKENAEKWRVAGINIDDSRIGSSKPKCLNTPFESWRNLENRDDRQIPEQTYNPNQGRWPANIIFDEEAAQELDRQTGISCTKPMKKQNQAHTENIYGKYEVASFGHNLNDSGGASRFFYCAKASSSERNKGFEGMPLGMAVGTGRSKPAEGRESPLGKPRENHHPTVKPIALMKYIIKLLAPPGDPILLDPFCGSGSTLLAAKELGIQSIGIELETEYVEIARKRLENIHPLPEQLDLNLGEL